MQECFSIRQQSVIKASDCDYAEHDGFLLCLVCDEPVFLRKSHVRNGHKVSDAFIHHKDSKFASTCELRSVINKQYTQKQLTASHNQTIAKLELKMWKCIRSNIWFDVSDFSSAIREARKATKDFVHECRCIDKFLSDIESTLWEDLTRTHDKLRTRLNDVSFSCEEAYKETEDYITSFSDTQWVRHLNITWKALKYFVYSPTMFKLRQRFYAVVLDRRLCEKAFAITKAKKSGIGSSIVSPEAWLRQCLIYTFLSIDWQALL